MKVQNFDSGYAWGDLSLLDRNPLAFYCSRKVPVEVAFSLENMVRHLAENRVIIAGGWNSPMEKRMFNAALSRDGGTVIHYLAKGITAFTSEKEYGPYVDAGRLLILSPFLTEPRITLDQAIRRDDWISRHMSRFFFGAVDPKGRLIELLQRLTEANKEVFLLHDQWNEHCIDDDVIAVTRENILTVLGVHDQSPTADSS